MSSLEDAEPVDTVEIRLGGRRPDDSGSEESEGVADGARSSLLMEAMERRGDSEEGGEERMLHHRKEHRPLQVKLGTRKGHMIRTTRAAAWKD